MAREKNRFLSLIAMLVFSYHAIAGSFAGDLPCGGSCPIHHPPKSSHPCPTAPEETSASRDVHAHHGHHGGTKTAEHVPFCRVSPLCPAEEKGNALLFYDHLFLPESGWNLSSPFFSSLAGVPSETLAPHFDLSPLNPPG